MAFVGPTPSAFQASRSEKEDALGGSCFDVFEAAGVTFWTFRHHFGRLWLPVATFQAHLAPESQKLENCAKNDAKIGAFLGPFWVPWAPLGSIREPPGAKRAPKVAQS